MGKWAFKDNKMNIVRNFVDSSSLHGAGVRLDEDDPPGAEPRHQLARPARHQAAAGHRPGLAHQLVPDSAYSGINTLRSFL